MNFSKDYKQQKFDVGEISNAFKKVFNKYSYKIGDIVMTVTINYGEITDSKQITIDELIHITEINERYPSISCRTNFLDKQEHFESIYFWGYSDYISLLIVSDYPEVLKEINEILTCSLSLTVFDKENKQISGKLDSIGEEKLAQSVVNKENLSCFISTRFDDKFELYFPKIERFLNLLDINVCSGREYQPRRISEKVLEILERKLDFLVYLVTNESETLWTRDELVTAKKNNVYIIILLEKGANFKSGIFGDIEYIEFDTNYIETSFLKLLEGINYIKKNKVNIA